MSFSSCALLDCLQITLILNHISPYLGIQGLISLAATSKSFRHLIDSTPSAFQHTDLTDLNASFDHNLLETDVADLDTDEVNARPLRRMLEGLERRHVLQDVRTLILDGLSVPAPILCEILCEESYNVRILSLINVRDLGDEKLMQVLRYIIRPSRPEGMPKLKGLYYFTPNDVYSEAPATTSLQEVGITIARGAQLGSGTSVASSALHRQLPDLSQHSNNPWYCAKGEVLSLDPDIELQWARLIQACEGLIAFDVVLCRHRFARLPYNRSSYEQPLLLGENPTIATISLRACQGCGSCPEGPAYPTKSAQNELPLLAPPPIHRPSIKVAQRLDTHELPHPPFIARCRTCLKDRWCEECYVWWCEACYTIPSKRGPINVSATPEGTGDPNIKVHNNLCVTKCLMDELLNGVGEGGMWG